MKKLKALSFVLIFILSITTTSTAFAQLGNTDTSQIRIQNISGASTSVTVQFISEAGVTSTPNPLRSSPAISNPFTLSDGQSILIDVSLVPGLGAGRYSVLISSTGKVVATASVFGETTNEFSGAYPSFDTGATTVYIPNGAFNYYGWFSMVSVMNVGASPANVTMQMICANSGYIGKSGTLSRTNLPVLASQTWALKSVVPTGLLGTDQCAGGIIITSSQPIVAVDNLNTPCCGQTNTYESISTSTSTVYVPLLSSNYYGWVSSLNIIKQGAGSTNVTVDYSDGAPDSTCSLSDATPSCMLFMPNANAHPTANSVFGAKITNSGGKNLLIAVGSTHVPSGLSGGYVGFAAGSHAVAAPMSFKQYFNWNTSINCMNVSATPTTLNIAYEGVAAFNDATTLNQGNTKQIWMGNDAHLPASFAGGIVITANAANALISCLMDNSLDPATAPLPGDWTLTYNAMPK